MKNQEPMKGWVIPCTNTLSDHNMLNVLYSMYMYLIVVFIQLQELEKEVKESKEVKEGQAIPTTSPSHQPNPTPPLPAQDNATEEPLETTSTSEALNEQKIKELEGVIQTLKSEKKDLEDKLDTYSAADKEKTDLVTAEKKARQYVRKINDVNFFELLCNPESYKF